MSQLKHDRFFSLQDQNIQEPEQRTPEWFSRRKHKLTGSKYSQLMFCDTDEDRIRIYEEIFEGRKKPPFPETAKQFMAWGCKYEDTALESFLNNMPHLIALEAPMVQHSSVAYMAASPDGFYEFHDMSERGCLEIKCPGKTKKANKQVTWYYVPQMYVEMACSGRSNCIFISWGLDTCRAWKLKWNENMWHALSVLIDTFMRTKDSMNPASYDDFLQAKFKLKRECMACVERAEILSPEEGWLTVIKQN